MAEPDSRPIGTVRERWGTLVAMAAVAALAVVVAVAVALATTDTELKRALLGGAFTLLFGGLLGGLVKLLLDDLDRGRQQRADRARFLNAVLADLKSVYDEAGRARVLIAAHQSAATYRDEMKSLIEARVKLRNVERALHDEGRLAPVRDHVETMDAYLTRLLREYEADYKSISTEQRLYEARVGAEIEANPTRGRESLPPNEPWEQLTRLEGVRDFLALDGDERETQFARAFVRSLDEASRLLRAELQSVLGSARG